MGRHDIEVRGRSVELIDFGCGKRSLTDVLVISVGIAGH